MPDLSRKMSNAAQGFAAPRIAVLALAVFCAALFPLLTQTPLVLAVEQPPGPSSSPSPAPPFGRSLDLGDQPRRYVYGYDREFPPFSYEREGKAAGFDVELLQAVLAGKKVRLMPRPMQWEQVLLELSSGNVQVSSSMIKTRQRALLYKFPSRPTLPLRARFFMKDFKRVANLEQLVAKKIGVKKASLYETMLKERGGMIVTPFESDLLALKAVQNEQVDAFFGADRTAFFLLEKTGMKGISPVGTPLAVTNVYYAVYREEDELLRQIEQGLRQVRESGEYDRLFRKWFVKEINKEQIETLIQRAREAAAFSYSPYSGVAVGAALMGRTGAIYTGCNVENGLPQLNAGALTVALQNAVSSGESDFRAVVSVRSDGLAVAPSAEERRLLFEFGPEILVITEPRKGHYETLMVTQLLPYPQEQEPEKLPESVD